MPSVVESARDLFSFDVYDDVVEPLFGGFVDKMADGLAEPIGDLMSLLMQPLHFAWATRAMTVFQGVAVAVVVVIVVIRGITSGILLEGGSEDESVGHYLFTSLVPVALIAATPVVTSLIATVTTAMVAAFTPAAADGIGSALAEMLARSAASTAAAAVAGANPVGMQTSLVASLLRAVLFCVGLYYLVTIAFQCIKRWIQLEVLSLITPLVCIMTAAEDNGDYVTILKSMASLGVITVLQVLLLASAPGILNSVDGQWLGLFLVVAVLGAIKQLPDWIEKYTYSSGVGGRGVMHVPLIALRAGTSVRNLAGAGRAAASAAKAA